MKLELLFFNLLEKYLTGLELTVIGVCGDVDRNKIKRVTGYSTETKLVIFEYERMTEYDETSGKISLDTLKPSGKLSKRKIQELINFAEQYNNEQNKILEKPYEFSIRNINQIKSQF